MAQALNDLAAMAAKRKTADAYRAEIRGFEEKEDRLFDRFDKGEVDRETYDRQLGRLRADKADHFEKLREADTEIDSAYLLARLVCNSRLDGRSVRFDLRKPFAVLAEMRAANDWRPSVEEFRTALIEFEVAA